MRNKQILCTRRDRKKTHLAQALKVVCAAGFICLSQAPSLTEAADINQDQQSQIAIGQSQKAENIKKLNQQQQNSVTQGQFQSGQNKNNSTLMNQVQFANANAYSVQTGKSTGPASMTQGQSISLAQSQKSPQTGKQQKTEIDTSQEQTMSVSNPSYMIQADITNVMSIQYQRTSANGESKQQDITKTHVFQYQIAVPNH